MTLNIALDGTSASGKSTVAKEVAKKLSIHHLDSGAIFRAITYKCVKEKIDIHNEYKICQLVNSLDIKIILNKNKNNIVQKNIIDGKTLRNNCIRSEKVSRAVSVIAQYACVRELVKKIQIELAKENDLIIDGRDIGTEIFPKTKFKFFLTAKAEERARRRLNQLGLSKTEFNSVLENIKERDKRDSERKISPLKMPKDAYYIDNTDESLEETVARIIDIINSDIKIDT